MYRGKMNKPLANKCKSYSKINININSFDLPLNLKVDFLLRCRRIAAGSAARFCRGFGKFCNLLKLRDLGGKAINLFTLLQSNSSYNGH